MFLLRGYEVSGGEVERLRGLGVERLRGCEVPGAQEVVDLTFPERLVVRVVTIIITIVLIIGE